MPRIYLNKLELDILKDIIKAELRKISGKRGANIKHIRPLFSKILQKLEISTQIKEE